MLIGCVSGMDTVAMALTDLALAFLGYYRKTTPGTSAGIFPFSQVEAEVKQT